MRYYDRNGHFSHSGIEGQKWHVRRYQNLDGTYTAEGKLRKKAYRESLRNANESNRSNREPIKGLFRDRSIDKRISEMSDEDLTAFIKRLELERRAKNLLSDDQGKQTSKKGQSFVGTLLQKSIEKAVLGSIDEWNKNKIEETKEKKKKGSSGGGGTTPPKP